MISSCIIFSVIPQHNISDVSSPSPQRSYKRYQASLKLFLHMEDKYGQLLALNGVAKTLGLMRTTSKICDCKPIEINNKVIDIAQSMGCKVTRSKQNPVIRVQHVVQNEVKPLGCKVTYCSKQCHAIGVQHIVQDKVKPLSCNIF